MAETFAEILEGPIDADAEIVECVANGDIPQWSPVVIVAPGTGEKLPRVGTTTTASDPKKYGNKVWPNRTLVAGDICWIQLSKRTKVKINAAVSRGDMLGTSTTAGKYAKITALDAPAAYAEADLQTELNKLAGAFVQALEDGAADGDIIVGEVVRNLFQR